MSAPPPRSSTPARPTTLTLVAIVDVVFGLWFTLGSAMTMFFPFLMRLMTEMLHRLPRPPSGGADPLANVDAMMQVYDQAWVKAYFIGSGAVTFFLGIALLAAGIGLFRLQPWARKTALAAAAIYSLVGLLGIVVGVVVNVQTFQVQRAMGVPANPGAAILGTLFGLVFVVIVPLANFVFLTRPEVRIALEAPAKAQLAKTFE